MQYRDMYVQYRMYAIVCGMVSMDGPVCMYCKREGGGGKEVRWDPILDAFRVWMLVFAGVLSRLSPG